MLQNLLNPLLAGRSVDVQLLGGTTERGTVMADAETPVDCVCYQRSDGARRVANIHHVRVLEAAEAAAIPAVQALKQRMLDVWDTLPVELRAALRPTKTAILDALNDNRLDEVPLLIQNSMVPEEFAEAKATMLDLLA